jgi:hypothetical protein
VQGSAGGTSVPFNDIPYGGGHIPPPSPSLSGAFQQTIGPNTNYNLFGAGILGTSSYTMSVGSMSFSLFDTFLVIIIFCQLPPRAGGNPGFGQQNPVQGTIPTQGASTRVFSSQGHWNPCQGLVPLQGMMFGGNPFHGQWKPGKGSVPMFIISVGGKSF